MGSSRHTAIDKPALSSLQGINVVVCEHTYYTRGTWAASFFRMGHRRCQATEHSSISMARRPSSSWRARRRGQQRVAALALVLECLTGESMAYTLGLMRLAGRNSNAAASFGTNSVYRPPWSADKINLQQNKLTMGFDMLLDASKTSLLPWKMIRTPGVKPMIDNSDRPPIIADSAPAQRNRGILGFVLDHEKHVDAPSSSHCLDATRSSDLDDAYQWNLPQTLYGRSRDVAETSRTATNTILAPPQYPWLLTTTQVSRLRVVDLKQACAERGLSKTGNKAELQDRLLTWSRAQARLFQNSGSNLLGGNLLQHYGVIPEKAPTTTPEISPLVDADANNDNFPTPPPASSLTANSLGEWARTVNLEPLLQRRKAIHREKLQGKRVAEEIESETDDVTKVSKAFTKPSSAYGNLQVHQMYAAAKQADQLGDRAQCKQILHELLVATPHDARIFRRLARLEREDGNMDAARSILRHGLKLHPKNGFLWHALGQLAALSSSEAEAKKYWRRAMDVDPSFPHPYHSLGTLQHSQGHIAAAMKTLKQGLDYCPTNHRLHHALGDLYRDAKMLDMARLSYKKALEHGPSVSAGFAYTGLAYVSYDQGQIDDARSWLRKAISSNDGRQANAWVALAQMEEAEGDAERAKAVCLVGIAQYERSLVEQQRRFRRRRKNDAAEQVLANSNLNVDVLRSQLFANVPTYRSGDRFFNLYRNWARLEENTGERSSVDEVYERATAAFSRNWQLALDWAQYYVQQGLADHARTQFAQACHKAGKTSSAAEPYRKYAEFEMKLGHYGAARRILYQSTATLLQKDDLDMRSSTECNTTGLTELLYTWAVCEWHLGALDRAEVLLNHAVQGTSEGDDSNDAELRAFILYSMARLQYFRGEDILAQHCIGLCLKENINRRLLPGGDGQVWDLWEQVAVRMENDELARECRKQADKARAADDLLLPLHGGTAPFSKSSTLSEKDNVMLRGKMRRDPWHYKIFSALTSDRSSFFDSGIKLPDTVLQELHGDASNAEDLRTAP